MVLKTNQNSVLRTIITLAITEPMTRIMMVLEMFVHSLFNNLTWLVA
jgi:hypothetical protein